MSQQDHTAIPLNYAMPQAPVRLIEFPPELLELIESDQPLPILYFKSAPSAPDLTGTTTTPNHAVLCTPTKTYTIRQVQTSNSLYLLHPTHPPSEAADPDCNEPNVGMAITSTCNCYLELHPCDSLDSAAVLLQSPHMRQPEVVYYGWDDDFGSHTNPAEEIVNLEKLKMEVPISEAEFYRAWREIRGFILRRPNGVMVGVRRVAPKCALEVLGKVVMAGEGVLGRKIFSQGGKEKGFRTREIMEAMGESDLSEFGDSGGMPVEVLEAVLRTVCDPLEGTWGSDGDEGEGWQISPTQYISVVGDLLLQIDWEERKILSSAALRAGRGDYLSIPTFLGKWRNNIPVECLEEVNAEKLTLGMLPKERWCCPTALTVSWVGPGEQVPEGAVFGEGEGGAVEITGGAAGAGAVAGVGRGRGKWHEKFAGARKRKLGV